MHKESLRDSFGKALVALAERYPEFVVFDADVAGGTSTQGFREAYPDRFIQCGIAEQNMMSAAAGYSTLGRIPFVTCYGVFASMRAVEQARNSIAYPDFNVKIVASHLGLDVGPDGVSHQAIEDLAIYRAIPNMVVLSPADDIEMMGATEWAIQYEGPIYMRSGRSPVPRVFEPGHVFQMGKGTVMRDGGMVAIVSVGVMVHRALEAANILAEDGISAAVINMSTLKPIDKELLLTFKERCGCMVTCEDHNIHGGLFSAVLEAMSLDPCPVIPVGIQDRYAESGDPEELARTYGIHVQDIVKAAKTIVERKTQ